MVDDSAGDLRLADDAEERVVEQMRPLGQESLQAWANSQVQRSERELHQSGHAWREGKKLYWHTLYGDIFVEEPQYRYGTHRIRPFVLSAQVRSRACSRLLQRALTD